VLGVFPPFPSSYNRSEVSEVNRSEVAMYSVTYSVGIVGLGRGGRGGREGRGTDGHLSVVVDNDWI
jgi:hypothetical protein